MRITAPDSLQGADSARLYGGTRRKVSAQVRQENKTMETTEKVSRYSPHKWAQENLSEPRARAFWRAYRELENAKSSEEYRAEWCKEEEIRIAYIRANLEKTNAIEAKARQEADELEEQARELINKAQELRKQAYEETSKIKSEVYQTDEYKAQRAKASELWQRDDEVFQPKVQALMDKYLKAQETSN